MPRHQIIRDLIPKEEHQYTFKETSPFRRCLESLALSHISLFTFGRFPAVRPREEPTRLFPFRTLRTSQVLWVRQGDHEESCSATRGDIETRPTEESHASSSRFGRSNAVWRVSHHLSHIIGAPPYPILNKNYLLLSKRLKSSNNVPGVGSLLERPGSRPGSARLGSAPRALPYGRRTGKCQRSSAWGERRFWGERKMVSAENKKHT